METDVKMSENVSDADSDDIIIVEGKSPRLPNFKEIDTVVRRIVQEATEEGKTAKEVKLKDCINRIQLWFDVEIMADKDCIKTICRSLRALQTAIDQKTAPPLPLQFYKGNISNLELECLDGNNWLNDKIMNRYMELISKQYPSFVAISSFFIESLNKVKINSANSNPEKLPDFRNKIALIPCCLNHHWSLILAMDPHKSLVIFSSMHNQIDDDDFDVFCTIRNHFTKITNSQWDLRIHTKLKSQNNSDDCGVFVLGYARCLVEGGARLNMLAGTHMKLLRKHIQEEIKDAKFRDWEEIFTKRKLGRLRKILPATDS